MLPTLSSCPALSAWGAALSDEDTQLARLLARPPVPPNPPLSQDEAVARMRAQMPLAEKVDYATAVLRNNGTEAELRTAVAAQVAIWRSHSKRWPTSWACWVCPPFGLLMGLLKLGQRWLAVRAENSRPGKGERNRL
jgi:dephospho-CoA kinase